MSAAEAILAHVRSLGYLVTVHRVNDTVELHAIPLSGDDPPQIVRCNDSDGPDEAYRAACLLAEAVGIDLEDG